MKAMGWKAVYEGFGKLEDDDDNEDNDQSLPNVCIGQTGNMTETKIINGKTKPPARYNEATLLSAMEHPSKFIQDKSLKEAIENTSGLGTPATRADIIEKLFNTFYIERKGKEIFPTSKGIQIIDIVPADLKSPELTAKWEQQLSLISKGKSNPSSFISEMKAYASKLVSAVIANSNSYKHDNVTKERCACGKFLLEVNGKKGKMLVCQDRECGYRKNVSQTSNARCPDCHKNLEIKGDGDNKSFICNCGYREKLSDFKKRKGEKVDKREVSNYLKHQNNSEPFNSPFAAAFSKLKKDK